MAKRVLLWAGWAIVIYVVAFWRLGYPSFWDPDEAVYAVVTRRMMQTGDWLAPIYNGTPFFDKPILFYWLQLLSFKLFGANEFAARLVPAVSAVGVIGVTGWTGRVFFNRQVGHLAAVIVAVLPATFLLSAYAILDMTFTMFLFAGVALAASAVVHNKPHREWLGYICLALAVLTKGPLALALAGLTMVITLVIAPSLRRAIWSLHFLWGLALVVAISSPWFIYMWWRFGYAFIDGYFLRENILLYASQLFETTRSPGFYLRIAAVGFLPFTPILIGRVVDGFRGDRISDIERLFWAWAIAITVFFSFSRFKLDHYIYPVLPALAVIAANTWSRLRRAESIRLHLGAAVSMGAIALTFVGAGIYAFIKLDTLPLDLSRAMLIVPAAFVISGVLLGVSILIHRGRPLAQPLYTVATLLITYAVTLTAGLDALESGKPMRDLGQWVAANAPVDATITAYRLERWKTSLRFYVDRHTQVAESPAEVVDAMAKPGTHYAVMTEDELKLLKELLDMPPVKIVRQRRGMTNTSGRGLRKRREEWPNYVVVTNDLTAATPAVVTPAISQPTVSEPVVSQPAVSRQQAVRERRAHLKGRPARRPPVRSNAGAGR